MPAPRRQRRHQQLAAYCQDLGHGWRRQVHCDPMSRLLIFVSPYTMKGPQATAWILCREGLGTSDEVEGYSRDDPSLIMRAYLPPDESLQGEVIGIGRKNTGTSTVDPSTNPNSLSAPSFLPGTVPLHRIVKLDWNKGEQDRLYGNSENEKGSYSHSWMWIYEGFICRIW